MKWSGWLLVSIGLFTIFGMLAANSFAAPGLPVTKPPVSGPYLTGPNFDPAATNGQWFVDLKTGLDDFRTHEFYDNTTGDGGGFMGAYAISGYVSRVSMDVMGNITNFDIKATIFNDTGTEAGQWLGGSNSHAEVNNNIENSYYGNLQNTKMTVDFAVSTNDALFSSIIWLPPYYDETNGYITALNEDQLAWYCWNENEQGGEGGTGAYHVPTWDFGTIPPGQSSTRVLQFAITGIGITTNDPRNDVIMNSYLTGADILINRTTSLKISEWIETPDLDIGIPYPIPPNSSSDVSVFFNRDDLDFGDAPYDGLTNRYETLITHNGACHAIIPGVMLGTNIDMELDGQPDPAALGDDMNGATMPPGDEDGVALTGPIYPGVLATVEVIASTPGYLNAWVDFASDGSWVELEDYAIQEYAINMGTNYVTFMVSTNAMAGSNTYARFRFSTKKGVTSYMGYAEDGEVEDYMWQFADESEAKDFGDAPDTYGTTLANNGAYHTIGGPWLGDPSGQPDPELNGQPDISALGDDSDGHDDERGVWIATGSQLIRGVTTNYTVTVGGSGGFFQMWVDWNQNGMFDDPIEVVANNNPLTSGTYSLPITPPTNAIPGMTFARCRISTTGGLPPVGPAPDGEVEDHALTVADGSVNWGNLQWPYSTTTYVGVASVDIYGQCYQPGVTPPSTIPAPGIVAQLGYGPIGSDTPRDSNWTWTDANFNSQVHDPNNDEYVAQLMIAATGSYSYAYRYSRNGIDWTYGDIDGSNNGYTNTQAGVITVISLPKFPITNIVVNANTATVWWSAMDRVVYQLQYTTNLSTNTPANWSNVGATVSGPVNNLSDTNAATPRFYRIIAPGAN